jgi:hypothetical protein
MAAFVFPLEFLRLFSETPFGNYLGIDVSWSILVLFNDIDSPDAYEMKNSGFLILNLNLSEDLVEILIGFEKFVMIFKWDSVHSSKER